MNDITIIDAIMGRGKSTAAMRYMIEHKDRTRFLYITPYLKEVDRVCKVCDFDQPEDSDESKSKQLIRFIGEGENIAATHSLFYLIDRQCIDLIKSKHYTLIIDESFEFAKQLNVSSYDLPYVVNHLTVQDEDGLMRWKDRSYVGAFSWLKEVADTDSLVAVGDKLYSILSPELLRAFDKIFILTYLFKGQPLNAYLDCFGFRYRIGGISSDSEGQKFSDVPERFKSPGLSNLIHIVNNRRMNEVGDGRTALSMHWYDQRGRDNSDVQALRKGMNNFFNNMTDGGQSTRLWTCYKDHAPKLVRKDGKYKSNFLQLSARATNDYRNCTNVAYMINRFANPNLTHMFQGRGGEVDQDAYALSEMLQWIWRSAIRDGKAINLYIPSLRMRTLLNDWLKEVS